MNQNVIEKFNNLLGEEKVKADEPMKRHTTFRIGGPADYFLMPSSPKEVKGIIEICKEESLPYFILGNGSNLLVSDKGYSGVILQINDKFDKIEIEGTLMKVQSGALLSRTAKCALEHGLTGLEFASGIPGTALPYRTAWISEYSFPSGSDIPPYPEWPQAWRRA